MRYAGGRLAHEEHEDSSGTPSTNGDIMKRLLGMAATLCVLPILAEAHIQGLAWKDLGGDSYTFYANTIFHDYMDPLQFPYADTYFILDDTAYIFDDVLNDVQFADLDVDGAAFNSWGVYYGESWDVRWLVVTITGIAGPVHSVSGTCGSWNAGCWPIPSGGSEPESLEINLLSSGVPIPAAFWLFGSGLGLLSFLRRTTVRSAIFQERRYGVVPESRLAARSGPSQHAVRT